MGIGRMDIVIIVAIAIAVAADATVVVGAHPGLVLMVDVVGLLKGFHKLYLTCGHGVLFW